MERHERGEARVIPVILRSASWKGLPFGKLQALPKNAKPITGWPSLDEALLAVTEGVKKVVEKLAVPNHESGQQARSYLQASQSNLPTERARSPIIATPLAKPPSTTPAGNITEFPVPISASGPWGITAGPDGNLWFTESVGNKIGRITSGK